ncbi:MAG: hypothetical protein A2X84_07750 [Desulfuromonadaceae bacterium GWC2_58_13]|nr:MAG: hypothetical protein A2X84_07750 [Desulfuromonadaceae bacterium GWC2_58_13]
MKNSKKFLILMASAGLILGMIGTAIVENATRGDCVAHEPERQDANPPDEVGSCRKGQPTGHARQKSRIA